MIGPAFGSDEIKLIQNPVLRVIVFISGFVFVAIGILGMFLPLLPTTVFLLLAAWCFGRSSEKFYRWVHYNRLFGRYIRDYQSGKGMSVSSKVVSIGVLWIGILASALLTTDNLAVRILLLLIAVGVTWHVVVLKTSPPPEEEKGN